VPHQIITHKPQTICQTSQKQSILLLHLPIAVFQQIQHLRSQPIRHSSHLFNLPHHKLNKLHHVLSIIVPHHRLQGRFNRIDRQLYPSALLPLSLQLIHHLQQLTKKQQGTLPSPLGTEKIKSKTDDILPLLSILVYRYPIEIVHRILLLQHLIHQSIVVQYRLPQHHVQQMLNYLPEP
jgi:hypothetical protein